MQTYTTERGRTINTRPYGALSTQERREILIELQTIPSREVKEKHNIANDVLSHLRYHSKHLLVGVVTPADRIASLRDEGYTSAEVAEKLGISLEAVNTNWPKNVLRYL